MTRRRRIIHKGPKRKPGDLIKVLEAHKRKQVKRRKILESLGYFTRKEIDRMLSQI